MLECLSDKWDRLDVAGFLAEYQENQEPLPKRAVHKMIQADRTWANPLIEKAAAEMAQEIRDRKVTFPAIHYSMRYDGNSGKIREIGVESIKQ